MLSREAFEERFVKLVGDLVMGNDSMTLLTGLNKQLGALLRQTEPITNRKVLANIAMQLGNTAFTMACKFEPARDVRQRLLEISNSKGSDYEAPDLGIDFFSYYPAGPSDLWVLVHGKCQRLRSVTHHGTAKHESLLDNCLDLVNYALRLTAWIQLEKKN